MKTSALIIAVLLLVGIWCGGYKKGETNERQKWLKVQHDYMNQLQAKQKLIDAIYESYNQIKLKLHVTERQRQDEITRDKDLINKYNRISHAYFVRYLQDSSGLPAAGDSSSLTAESATIPADQVLHWTSGLISHDCKCAAQLNNLIDVILKGRNE